MHVKNNKETISIIIVNPTVIIFECSFDYWPLFFKYFYNPKCLLVLPSKDHSKFLKFLGGNYSTKMKDLNYIQYIFKICLKSCFIFFPILKFLSFSSAQEWIS